MQPNCKEWNGLRKLEGEVLIIQTRDESCLYYVSGNKNGKKWMNSKDDHHWSICYQKLLDVKRPMFRRVHRKVKIFLIRNSSPLTTQPSLREKHSYLCPIKCINVSPTLRCYKHQQQNISIKQIQGKKNKLLKEIADLIKDKQFYEYYLNYVGEYQNHTKWNKD